MSMYTLLRSHPLPSVAQVERALEGNLCRCTGYRPILDGFRKFTKEAQCAMGDACCKLQKTDDDTSTKTSDKEKEHSEYLPYDSSQEPIFPSELQLSTQLDEQSLVFTSEKVTWYRPTSLQQLLELKTTHPDARLIGGNYEQLMGFGHHPRVIIDSSKVPEMKEIKLTDMGLMFGSSVTLSEMEEILQQTIDQLPEHKTRLFKSLLVKLGQVGSLQLRNSATLGGHIMAASTSSDLNTQFLASRSRVTVVTPGELNTGIAL
ncbi:hypothetical protein NP493_1361g00002 [Ridgeia piscesae]|uniref:FAD-binding PCMH-type domain-containing protein n=1 Tax=Ridgeia piscesae TaxID=27915 RepID=A0AAD9K5Y8_RIDPI|nr:hypothetical protein NP493_1361g00002 [Ridgeia piscesae]